MAERITQLTRTSTPFFLSIFFAALLCSCNAQKGSDEQEKSGPEYSIAYNVLLGDTGSNYEVFTMDLDGANNRNVTNLDGVEWTYASAGSIRR